MRNIRTSHMSSFLLSSFHIRSMTWPQRKVSDATISSVGIVRIMLRYSKVSQKVRTHCTLDEDTVMTFKNTWIV